MRQDQDVQYSLLCTRCFNSGQDATSKPSKARGIYSYRHVDAETQAKIAQYACEHGNKAAMECLSIAFDIKKSSVTTLRAESKRYQR